MRKRRNPEVGTWYAIKDLASGKYHTIALPPNSAIAFIPPRHLGPFPDAWLYPERPRISALAVGDYVVVDVRARPLSTRTRASKKRTR